MFRDEATFLMNGYVKRRNYRICIEKRPREMYEHVRNFQKVTVCCSIMQDNVIGSFVFAKKHYQGKHLHGYITNIYLSMNRMLLNKINAKCYCKKTVSDHFSHEVQGYS